MREQLSMQWLEAAPPAKPFTPHPALGEDINRNICASEVAGGVWLNRLPAGTRLVVWTAHRPYFVETCGGCDVLISGHPEYCPEPVGVAVHGSTWGGSMIKLHFIGRGMRLEFRHPIRGIIRTSPVREIRELPREQAGCTDPA